MILALDYGEKRIGIALTDESGKMATAYPYISNKSEVKRITHRDFPKGTDIKIITSARRAVKSQAKVELRKVFNILLHFLNSYYPEKILIGLPMVLDKDTNNWVEGFQAKKIRNFMKKFETFLKQNKIICEIIFLEESMTSKQAESNLKEMHLTSDKIREKIDSEAARILLEEYLGK